MAVERLERRDGVAGRVESSEKTGRIVGVGSMVGKRGDASCGATMVDKGDLGVVGGVRLGRVNLAGREGGGR